MANPFRYIGEQFRAGVDQFQRHPVQGLIQLAAGAIAPGAGIPLGQAFQGYNQRQGDQRANNWLANDRANTWLANNGGVPADLQSGSTQSAPQAPTATPRPLLEAFTRPQGGDALSSGDALAAFQNRAQQDMIGASGDLQAQIERDTVEGNYTRPNASQPSRYIPSQAGSTSAGGFTYRTGAARSMDPGAALGALGEAGHSGIVGGGQTQSYSRSLLGLNALQRAAREGDTNAQALLEQSRQDRLSGVGQGGR